MANQNSADVSRVLKYARPVDSRRTSNFAPGCECDCCAYDSRERDRYGVPRDVSEASAEYRGF